MGLLASEPEIGRSRRPDLGMAFLTVLGVEDSSTRRLRDRGTLSGLRLFERFEC